MPSATASLRSHTYVAFMHIRACERVTYRDSHTLLFCSQAFAPKAKIGRECHGVHALCQDAIPNSSLKSSMNPQLCFFWPVLFFQLAEVCLLQILARLR